MPKVLIATLGLSPGVVTGAYFTLAREGHQIDRVITITTDNVAAIQCENLIAQTLLGLEQPPEYHRERPVHETYLGQANVTYQLSQRMYEVLLAEDGADEIFLVLTGGRTSMAAALMLSLQKYILQRSQVHTENIHLYHVEVLLPQDKTIPFIDLDQGGHIHKLQQKLHDEQRVYMDPPSNAIILGSVDI